MNILEVKNIEKSFGDAQVHRGISFGLQRSESLGLLGRSGTGKSVLLRSIIGLERVDNGEIYFKGKRIDNLREEHLFEIRTKISYAFQSGALFDSMNVFENLSYPLREHTNLSWDEIDKKVDDALNVVGLPRSKYAMPSDLSGGMQKRIGLARSIILDPEVILYDEPTAGLDPKNISNVVGIMKNLKQRKISSIFVTHDMPAAMEFCDRIVIIGEGKVRFNGSPSEMRQSSDPYVLDFFAMEGNK